MKECPIETEISLLTTAAALAFGLTATAALAEDPVGDAPGAKSDITIVKDATGNAPSGVQGQAAPDQDNAAIPDPNDGGAAAQGDPPRTMRAEQPHRAVPKIKTVQARWQPNPL